MAFVIGPRKNTVRDSVLGAVAVLVTAEEAVASAEVAETSSSLGFSGEVAPARRLGWSRTKSFKECCPMPFHF